MQVYSFLTPYCVAQLKGESTDEKLRGKKEYSLCCGSGPIKENCLVCK